jgi:capsular polysaccharide biosynthesis protein
LLPLGRPWTVREAAVSAPRRPEGGPEPVYIECFPEEEIHFDAAKGLNETLHEHLREKIVTAPPAFAAVIPNGRVWGWDGAVLTSDRRLLRDVSMEFSRSYIVDNRHSIYRRWRRNPIVAIPDTVGVLTHPGGTNYYHWLFDIVPRIALLERAGIPIDQYVMVRNSAPYQDEILRMLGIPPAKRIYTHSRFHLRARQLVVPSLTSKFDWSSNHYPVPKVYSRWAYDFVRERLLPHGQPPDPPIERLYVSRAMAGQRKLLNEHKMIEILLPRGFQVVHPETMTVREQIGLFASAKVIVAPHGAGLANLAFCSPGTRVIELFPPNYVPGYFWMLSRYFDLDHYGMIGNRRVYSGKPWAGGADFTVDPDRFVQLLEKAGVGWPEHPASNN